MAGRDSMDLRLLMRMQLDPSIRESVLKMAETVDSGLRGISAAGQTFSDNQVKNIRSEMQIARIAAKDRAAALIEADLRIQTLAQKREADNRTMLRQTASEIDRLRTFRESKDADEHRLIIARYKEQGLRAQELANVRLQVRMNDYFANAPGARVGRLEGQGAMQAGMLFNDIDAGRSTSPMVNQARALAEIGSRAKFAGEELTSMGERGSAGAQKVRRPVQDLNGDLDKSGGLLEKAKRVFDVFLLYKGFVFLKTQTQEYLRTLIDLEHQVALVTTQLDTLSAGSSTVIRREIVLAAQETGMAFGDVARAEYQIISASIGVRDSFEVMRLSARAAVAGGINDVSAAFNSALTQINAFNLSNQQFGRIYDLQFNLVKRGIFNYQQLSNVIGEISIAFAGMGQEVEVSNAALAAVSQVFTGSQLEQGATGLKNAVIRMTTAFQDFEKFGVQIVDPTNGKFRDFIDIIGDLKVQLDSLSESGKAEALKQLFPDIRERRGIQALLTQTEELNRFYYEQKLSMGDLDKAYMTVNQTMQTQVGILKNSLVPISEGLLDTFGLTVRSINEMDRIIPGLTQNVVSLAGAMLLLKAAMSTGAFGTGGRFALSGSVPLSMGNSSIGRFLAGGRGMTSLGMGVLGVTAGLAGFESGRNPNMRPIDAIGSIGAGAASGALLGGIPGAVAGAVIAGIGVGIGVAMKREEPDIQKTFSTAFADAIKDNKKTLQEAFSFAQGIAVNSSGLPDLSRAGETPQFQTGTFKEANVFKVIGRLLGGQSMDDASTNVLTLRTANGPTVADTVKSIGRDLAEFDRRAKDLKGIVPEGEVQSARDKLIDERIKAAIPITENMGDTKAESDANKQAAEANRALATSVLRASLSADQVDKSFSILRTQGVESFFKFLRGELDTEGKSLIKTWKGIRFDFEATFSGEFSTLAQTFGTIGKEGVKAADALSKIGAAQEGFDFLDKLSGLNINGKNGLDFFGIDAATVANALFKNALIGSGSKMDGDELTKEIIAAFTGGMKGGKDLTATGLVDELDKAAAAIDLGLIEPLGYTGSQIHAFADDLRDYDKKIFKVGILQELLRLSNFVPSITDEQRTHFNAVLADFIKSIEIGGQSFAEVFRDPMKLADLLSNLQFGDINVDQSFRPSIVVRISGGTDLNTLKASEIAEEILKELNNNQRDRSASR